MKWSTACQRRRSEGIYPTVVKEEFDLVDRNWSERSNENSNDSRTNRNRLLLESHRSTAWNTRLSRPKQGHRGDITILRHVLCRWLLDKCETFPEDRLLLVSVLLWIVHRRVREEAFERDPVWRHSMDRYPIEPFSPLRSCILTHRTVRLLSEAKWKMKSTFSCFKFMSRRVTPPDWMHQFRRVMNPEIFTSTLDDDEQF